MFSTAGRPRLLGEQISGSQESEDLAPKVLLDQGQVVTSVDRDPDEGAVRAQAPVGGDQVRVWVVREIRVEGLQDRHDAGLETVLAEGLTEEIGEDLGGQAAQLAEQGRVVPEEGTDALGDGEHPLPMGNIRQYIVDEPLGPQGRLALVARLAEEADFAGSTAPRSSGRSSTSNRCCSSEPSRSPGGGRT